MTGRSATARAGERLRPLLSGWYRAQRRDLPWRGARSAYEVLVSEVMLQQTQVSRVIPAYRAFLERFPTAAALAAADPAEVLRRWRGLGYNRRALALHRAAVAVTEKHGGRFPEELGALRALPGVGEYTARAVLAFAFAQPVAPVDVNVARVLARAVAGAPLSRASAQRLADELVPVADPAGWTSALMDLGAGVCTARAPRCDACPLDAICGWRRNGGEDPARHGAVRSRPQRRFAGSDRYHRGRLVDALRAAPLAPAALAAAADLADPERLRRITAGLVADGLARWHEGELRLGSGTAQ